MPTKTEAVSYRAEFVRSMGEGSISLDKGVLNAGQNLAAGTVLGRLTTGGDYTILAPAASDGSQNAAAILWDKVDATAADTPVTVLTRLAEVKADLLTFPAGITAPQKAAAIAALAALQIIVR